MPIGGDAGDNNPCYVCNATGEKDGEFCIVCLGTGVSIGGGAHSLFLKKLYDDFNTKLDNLDTKLDNLDAHLDTIETKIDAL